MRTLQVIEDDWNHVYDDCLKIFNTSSLSSCCTNSESEALIIHTNKSNVLLVYWYKAQVNKLDQILRVQLEEYGQELGLRAKEE
ncbi:hypothetical protein C9J12_09035 [Photobacterium frigidiphilum]|uniref:Uncharacterized protein n=1 Tax=Photobacterium frigidiphilum TaxID=264736 RepID=A0A2T3JJF6_9GAMM|nr:hypothetical protein C9J12_09035 [Photobacterium frigidiphilum]